MKRRTRLSLRLLGLSAATLASGCIGLTTAELDDTYSGGEWRATVVPVVVRGTPFAVPQAELSSAVTDGLRGGAPSGTHLIAAPEGSLVPYRVIVLFNPANGIAREALCTRPEPPGTAFGTAPAPSVYTMAALCRGDRAISMAETRLATGGGPESTAFRGGIGGIAALLFPPRNPQNLPGHDKIHGV